MELGKAPILRERFEDALRYAAQLHASQVRKGTGTPYISHLLAVASLVIEAGGDEDEAIAALLHDAVEDQGGTAVLGEIEARFGKRVTEIVDGCSECYGEPKPLWQERKASYLEHLKTASPSVLLVSIADKIHNARSVLSDYRRLGEGLWGRFKGGRDGTLWYYRALLDVYRTVGPEHLREMINEFERILDRFDNEIG